MIFPKKEVLHAPMLGTFGGGSIGGYKTYSLGEKQWLMLFDENITHRHDDIKTQLRFNDTNESGYACIDFTPSGFARGARVFKFNKDGVIEDWIQVDRAGGLEPKSFDVFPNGKVVVMGEDGGNTYMAMTDTSMNLVSNGLKLYSAVYGGDIQCHVNSNNDEIIVLAARNGSSPQLYLRNYYTGSQTGQPTDNRIGNYGQARYHNGQSTILPMKVISHPTAYKYAVCGYDTGLWNTSSFLSYYNENYYTDDQDRIQDVGGYNDTDICYGIDWEYGNRAVANNTNYRVMAAGYTANGSNSYPWMGYGQPSTTGGFSNTVRMYKSNGYSDGTGYFRSVAYDDINYVASSYEKAYAVGQVRSPLAARNTSGGGSNRQDGLITRWDVSSQPVSLDWAIGISQNHPSYGEQDVKCWEVKVDNDGSLLVYFTAVPPSDNRTNVGICRINTDGSTTGGANGINFYNATSYFTTQHIGANGNNGTMSSFGSASWSEVNQTMYGRTISNSYNTYSPF